MGPCQLKVCRICFAMDCQLHLLHENIPLYKGYEAVTGLILANEEGLPPYLCTNCADQQTNYVRFMNKSLQAHLMLLDILKNHGHISVESIRDVIKTNDSGYDIELTEKERTCSNFKIEVNQEDISVDPIPPELGVDIKIEYDADDVLVVDNAVAPSVVETNDIVVKEEVIDEAKANDYLDDSQSKEGSDTYSEYEGGATGPSAKKLRAGIVQKQCVTYSRQDLKPSDTQSTGKESSRERKKELNRVYQREFRQRKKNLEQKDSKEIKEARKRKRHRENQRVIYPHQRTKGLKKNVEGLLQKKLDDLQIESTKASTTEVQTITSRKRKKTNAQKCREYRERKKLQNTMIQNITAERSDECRETDQLPAKKPKTDAERRKKYYEAQKLKKQKSKKIPKTAKQRNKECYDRKKKLRALNTLNHSDVSRDNCSAKICKHPEEIRNNAEDTQQNNSFHIPYQQFRNT